MHQKGEKAKLIGSRIITIMEFENKRFWKLTTELGRKLSDGRLFFTLLFLSVHAVSLTRINRSSQVRPGCIIQTAQQANAVRPCGERDVLLRMLKSTCRANLLHQETSLQHLSATKPFSRYRAVRSLHWSLGWAPPAPALAPSPCA